MSPGTRHASCALPGRGAAGAAGTMANSEFWRGFKPIEQKFRPGARPEAYIANAPTEDDRFYACDEPMRVTFNVTGPLIWLDENGEPNGTFDVFGYIALVRDHYAKNGIGADFIDQLMR